jgi:hypothetical protein
MAQYLFLYRRGEFNPSPAEMQANMQKWTAWFKELTEQGCVVDRGQPLESAGKTVGGASKKNITDGPYAEKDLVVGFTIIEARDLAHASEISLGCPIFATKGLVEVRPVMKM